MTQNVERIYDWFKKNNFSFEISTLKNTTKTADEAAKSIGCSIGQIAKSIVFKKYGTEVPILIIVSGSNRVNLKKIEEKTGLKLIQADGNFIKRTIGFTIGGIPPVGHLNSVQTFIDIDLKKYKEIWASAGSPFSVFKLKPTDLDQLTNGIWLNISDVISV